MYEQTEYAAQPVAQYVGQPVAQYAGQPVQQVGQHAARPAGGLPADHPFAGAERRISRAARRRVHSRERRVRRTRAAAWSQASSW